MSDKLMFSIGADLKELDSSLSAASAKIKEFSTQNTKQFENLGKSFTDIGKKVTIASAVVTGFGFLAVRAFGEVDKGLREVNSLFGLTGKAAEDNFSDLIDITKQASTEVGILQSEISKGLYNAISAGVPKDNALDFIVVAGKAAIGGVTDLNTAVDGITTVINAFGKNFSEAEAVADSLFAAVQGGKTTFEELSASLFNIAPAAAASKVSMEEVNAAIATLTASGTPTKVATTQLRAALTGLQKPSEELDRIFQALGFQNAQLAIESNGLQFALQAVKDASNGNNGVLQTLLGSVEAVAAANVLAGTSSEKFTSEIERQANAAGSAQNAFNELEKSFPRQLERLKVQFNNIAIEIGSKLAPVVGKIADFISKLAAGWDKLSDSTKNVILSIGGLIAVMGPLLVAVGTLIKFLPLLATAFAVLTGPIGLIVAGVIALTVAVVKNWKTVRQWAEDVVNYFIRLYNQSIVFRAGIEGLILNFKTTFEVVKFVFKAIVEIITMSVKQIIEGLKTVGDLLVAVFTLDFKGVKEALSKGFTAGFENIRQGFTNIANDAVTLFNNVSTNIKTAVTNTLNESIQEVSFDPLEKKIKDATSEGVVQGFEQGLNKIGSGRGSETALTAPAMIQGGMSGANIGDTQALPIEQTISQLEVWTQYVQLLMSELNENVNLLFEDALAGTITDVADTLGRALAGGGNIIQELGKSLIQSMGKLLSNLGKLYVQYGVAALAFAKTTAALANPVTAKGAAIKLIAIGAVLSTLGGAIGAVGSGGGGGGGGTVSSGGGSSVGGQSSISTQSFQAQRDSEVVFRISGTDLRGVLRRVDDQENRIG